MLSWQRLATVLTIGFVAILAVSDARAEQYPSRQVTIVVPYPAGVPFDLLARALAERLRPKLGGAVIVENRPGGNGVVATQAALQAKPDGHTLLLGSSAFTSIPLLMDKPGYATTDFTAIAPLGTVSYMLFVGGQRAGQRYTVGSRLHESGRQQDQCWCPRRRRYGAVAGEAACRSRRTSN